MRRLFADECDVLVTPAAACVAPRLPDDAAAAGLSDAGATSAVMRFAFLANLTGIPAVTVPIGVSARTGMAQVFVHV